MSARPLLFGLGLLLAGCGGAGGAQNGRMIVRMAWPNARVVPTAATSVRVQVIKDSAVVGEALLSAGTPSASFAELPTGSVTVQATAFPTAGGTGTAMAKGQVVKTVLANSTENVDLTMASTIDRLGITPATLSLTLGATTQLTVTAYDASNAVVLTAPSDIVFTSNGLLNVSTAGVVKALIVGIGSVTATDSISGKSASLPVQITVL